MIVVGFPCCSLLRSGTLLRGHKPVPLNPDLIFAGMFLLKVSWLRSLFCSLGKRVLSTTLLCGLDLLNSSRMVDQVLFIEVERGWGEVERGSG